jgi:hypothetical protein
MKMNFVWRLAMCVLGVSTACTVAARAAQAADAECNRACLENVVDNYLNALEIGRAHV